MNNKKCYGPFQLWVLNNFPFTIDDWDSITQYQMLCKCLGALKEQLDVNSDLYKKIQDIENYLANLDLQDEVDHKIDEMVESGELEEIITSYLQIKGVLGFDTISDMKNGSNLINGSICRTLGNTTYNDGKGAYFRIRTLLNTDIIDEVNIIALTNYPTLIAELIFEDDKNYVTLDQFKTPNDSDYTNAFNLAVQDGRPIILENKEYNVSDTITITENTVIKGLSMTESIINSSSNDPVFEYVSEIKETAYDIKSNIELSNFKCLCKNFIKINDSLNTDSWLYQGSILHLIFKNLWIRGSYIEASDSNKNTNVLPTIDIKDFGVGFELNDVFDSVIENCNINGFGIGIYLNGSDINLIDNNRFTYNGVHIWLDRILTYGSQNRIEHNDMLYNYRYGSIRVNGTYFDSIIDNYFENYENSGCFIYANNEYQLILNDNRFDSPRVNIDIVRLAPKNSDIINNNRLNPNEYTPSINVEISNLDTVYLNNYNSAYYLNNNSKINLKNNGLIMTNIYNPLILSPYNINRNDHYINNFNSSSFIINDSDFNILCFDKATPSKYSFLNCLKNYAKPTKIRLKCRSLRSNEFYYQIFGDDNQIYSSALNIANDGLIHTVEINTSDNNLYNKIDFQLSNSNVEIFSIELI